jgi:multidrug efflux system membrane fusion protein
VQADQEAVENAGASIRAVQATVESVRSVLQADKAALENARVQLDYTTIRAPMDSRAGNLLVRTGSAVKARDDTAQLVVLNQFHPIYVSFSVPEQALADIRRYHAGGIRVEAFVPNSPAPAKGELTFINNTVDTTTGTIQLKATFPNHEGMLWSCRRGPC